LGATQEEPAARVARAGDNIFVVKEEEGSEVRLKRKRTKWLYLGSR